MSTSEHGWYIAEPDGTTVGPMSRAELNAAAMAHKFSASALAWHVDVSEWRLLSAVATGHTAGVSTALPSKATHQPHDATAPSARIRQEQAAAARPHAPTPADAQERMAKALARLDPEQRVKAERSALRKQAQQKKRPEPAHDDGGRQLSQAQAKPATAPAAAPVPALGTPTASAAMLLVALRRLLARTFDMATLGIAAAAFLYGVARGWGQRAEPMIEFGEPHVALIALLAPLALLPLEALALAIAGTTPGKALLGLSVRRRDGGRLNPIQALRRSGAVFVRGMGLGIPLLTPFTIIAGGVNLINKGETSWDARNGLQIRAAELKGGRFQVAAVAVVALWFLLTSQYLQSTVQRIANFAWLWMLGA